MKKLPNHKPLNTKEKPYNGMTIEQELNKAYEQGNPIQSNMPTYYEEDGTDQEGTVNPEGDIRQQKFDTMDNTINMQHEMMREAQSKAAHDKKILEDAYAQEGTPTGGA